MNKRQAKKQYKKIHGHNPPKTAVTKYTPEEMEAMKVYNLTPEDIERIGNGLRDAFAEMFKTLQRVAESMARAFEDMGKKYSRPVIETEEPPVVVARTMSERYTVIRTISRTNTWPESTNWTERQIQSWSKRHWKK